MLIAKTEANLSDKTIIMKNAAFVLFAALIFLQVIPAKAQEPIPDVSIKPTSGFYAGGQAATSGLGLNVRYILNERFTFKTGVETLNFNTSFDFDENDIDYAANLNYKTGGIFLLADYFYLPALYVSAGAAVNHLNPKVKGEAVDDFQYGDITIPASKIGDFKIEMEPSMKISPYGGIGFRQFFGKKNQVVYNFETGLYYMGEPQVNISANGLLAPTADPAHHKKELFEKQLKAYKYYPVVKMNVAVKLF